MVDELNYKTFDLGAVLAGQDYPEKTVDVYFNEALAYEVAKANNELSVLVKVGGDAFTKAEKAFDELLEKISKYRYVFHLKAIPSSVRRQIQTEVDSKFPPKHNPIGLIERNKDSEDLFSSMMMEAYITKIVDPDGAEIVKPSIDIINDLRTNAPVHVIKLLESEIIDFDSSVANGFEVASKSADFLSKP